MDVIYRGFSVTQGKLRRLGLILIRMVLVARRPRGMPGHVDGRAFSVVARRSVVIVLAIEAR